VRVIAATHQALEARVADGRFREDLLHRLNVIRVALPPLRARREDIPELLRHYLDAAGRELGVEPKALSAEAERVLSAFDWPGNVRELVNACRRLTVSAPGREIEAKDVPADLGGAMAPGLGWQRALAQWAAQQLDASPRPLLEIALPEFERALIEVALSRAAGRRQHAARLLGWGRNTLTRKLRELNMGAADPDPE
jgi:two-component system nitrogen regulation response regulator GlnG